MKQARLDELELEPRVREALASLFRRLDEETWSKMKKVILYGSVARGEGGPKSDVDLLVIWDGPEVEGMERLGTPSTDVLIETGNDIAVHIVGPSHFDELNSHKTTFYLDIERERIIVKA